MNREKSLPDNTNLLNETGEGVAQKETLPQARKRDRFDKDGDLLRTQGIALKERVYFEYKKIALFRHRTVYELINEAMIAYLPELKKRTSDKLREAGQQDLPLDA